MSKKKILVGDFETTVYEGQTETEVWASAVVELYTENVQIHHSIEETWYYLKKLKSDVLIYYHNLQFDGVFWLVYFLQKLGMKQAYSVEHDENGNEIISWLKDKDMPANSIKYSISLMGKYYYIIVKTDNHKIEFRDSLKLLPYSVARMGKSFNTKHQKLEMEYKGFRFAGCKITDEEKHYIANDVLVVKECLEHMYDSGHSKLTIGSCCISEFKSYYYKTVYKEYFPDLSEIHIDSEYGCDNAYDYIHKSYRGGWCYVVKGCEQQVYRNGITADVNSLYPSQMHSSSGNRYPIGKPTFRKGDKFFDKVRKNERDFYFIRIKCRFKLKDGKLPFIQIKGNPYYKSNDYPETSDIYNPKTGKYCRYYVDFDGTTKEVFVTLTLAKPDYELFYEHYDVYDCTILDYCVFDTEIGIFDDYLNQYKKQKETSTGAKREEAKLFMNNLYGKMSTNSDSSFKLVYIGDDEILHYKAYRENKKKVGYIACGSAITSYAKNFTIRHAQMNYYGKGKRGFKYADTDSIHCDLTRDELKGIKVHPTDFNAWKLESFWDEAIFVRQKTYIEHVTHENEKEVTPYYNVKGAGIGTRGKELMQHALNGTIPEKANEHELEFVKKGLRLVDFRKGLTIPSNLRPHRIKGGILLVEEDKTIH